MSEYRGLLNAIGTLARDVQVLHAQGVALYTPIVQAIVATSSRDASHIEHTLDGLLDFACHPEGLKLFKALCRHYYPLAPAATADYINAYRELWDADEAPAHGVTGAGAQP